MTHSSSVPMSFTTVSSRTGGGNCAWNRDPGTGISGREDPQGNPCSGALSPKRSRGQFWRLIEYFGQSPIIIQSSSLLEDAFGNAFAGKYEYFLRQQGHPEERYKQFGEHVRRVYASTMNEDALAYRLQRASTGMTSR